MSENTLEQLRTELAAHLQTMPVLPQPYDPHTPQGRAYYAARAAWSDTRRHLEHEIFKAETPKTQALDRRPKAIPRAYSQAPVRFRP
jgi:hypothetical protein